MNSIDEKDFKKVWDVIKTNKSFLLTAHINIDADALCSLLALAYPLTKFKKNYNIVLAESLPSKLDFIIKKHYKIIIPEFIYVPESVDLLTQLKENYFPDVIIIVDCGGKERLGNFSKHFNKAKTILNIDHHPGNRHIESSLNLIDTNASATSEIIYELFRINNFEITKEIAELLYTGICVDTRFFTQANTTAKTLKIAADLIEKGAEPENIANNLQLTSFNTLKVFGKILNRLEKDFNGKLVYSFVTNEELKECNNNIEGAVELLRNIDTAVVSLLFKELDKNKIKISMRGKNNFNVLEIAYKFNGGGHLQAAGCTINDTLKNAIKIILNEFKEKLS